MLLLPLRWLIWLLALSVPAQASAGAWLRAQGPAHLHLDAIGSGRAASQQTGHGHSHGHAGSRIAPHEHAPAQDGVLYLSDGGGTDRGGTPQSADKASALEIPGLPTASSVERCERVCLCWRASPALYFASVSAQAPYRPPR